MTRFGNLLLFLALVLMLVAVIDANFSTGTSEGAWFERGVCVVSAVLLLIAVYLREGDRL